MLHLSYSSTCTTIPPWFQKKKERTKKCWSFEAPNMLHQWVTQTRKLVSQVNSITQSACPDNRSAQDSTVSSITCNWLANISEKFQLQITPLWETCMHQGAVSSVPYMTGSPISTVFVHSFPDQPLYRYGLTRAQLTTGEGLQPVAKGLLYTICLTLGDLLGILCHSEQNVSSNPAFSHCL